MSTHRFPHEIALLSLKEETDRVHLAGYSNAGKGGSSTTVVVNLGTGPTRTVSRGEGKSVMAGSQ